MVLYEDLHHQIAELDIHNGGHGLFLGSEKRGAEADPEVGDGHLVDVALARHPGG